MCCSLCCWNGVTVVRRVVVGISDYTQIVIGEGHDIAQPEANVLLWGSEGLLPPTDLWHAWHVIEGCQLALRDNYEKGHEVEVERDGKELDSADTVRETETGVKRQRQETRVKRQTEISIGRGLIVFLYSHFLCCLLCLSNLLR
jgi:hypothetical protein